MSPGSSRSSRGWITLGSYRFSVSPMWTISLMPASRAARLASLGISMPMISSAGDTMRALMPRMRLRCSVATFTVSVRFTLLSAMMSGSVARPVWQMCRKGTISVAQFGRMWRQPPNVAAPALPASTRASAPFPPATSSTPSKPLDGSTTLPAFKTRSYMPGPPRAEPNDVSPSTGRIIARRGLADEVSVSAKIDIDGGQGAWLDARAEHDGMGELESAIRRWKRVEYERLIDKGVFTPGERLELIDGLLLVAEPQSSSHFTAVRLAAVALTRAFGAGWDVRTQGPIALDDASEPEPDVAVVRVGPRDYAEAHPADPVLVVEVALTSLAFDREHKSSLYARAGRPEYWIVNLVDRVLEVRREPRPVASAPYAWDYDDVETLRPGERARPLAAPAARIAVMRMLMAGGNAFDAAVAAGFAAAVVEPTASYTLCGECVAMVYDAWRGETYAVSGQGTTPALATPAFFRGRGLDRIPTGPGPDAHLSFTVPGAVDAYLTLLETHGTRTVAEVLAPAVHYAEHGFPMYEYMHRLLATPETRSQFDVYPPGGTAVFYPNGRPPAVGELLVQPALAATLRKLVEAEAGSRGHRGAGIAAARDRFYRGDVAATIGAFSERLGGLLRQSDLAAYRAQLAPPRLEPPLRMTFAGREIVGQSAWTQGPVLMQALAMLATLDLRALGHNSPRYIHVVAEALKLAFADRERYYGDAQSVPMAELLSPAYARERATLIRPDRAAPEAPAPGD